MLGAAFAWSSVVLFAPPAARSADPVPDEITFVEALRLSDGSPRERGLRDAVDVRRSSESRIRGLPSSPQVNVYPGLRIAPSSERGPQVQIQVTQALSLERLGPKRRQAAAAERAVLSSAADGVALERRLDTAQAWMEAWALGAQLEILRRELDTTDEWQVSIQRLVDAGERTRGELAAATAWRAEIELDVLGLEGRLHHAGLRLSELVGASDATPLLAAGEPPVVDLDDADLERLAGGVDRLPVVVGPRLAAAAARARDVEAKAEAGWKLELGGMLQVDQPGPAVGVFGQVGLEVPLWGRDVRGRAVSRGEAARLEGEADAQRRQAQREIEDVLHELEHTEAQLRALRSRLVPALDDLVAVETRSLRAGETTVWAVVQARRDSMAAQRRLAAVAGDHAWTRMRVWLLSSAMVADTEGAQR